MATGFATDFFFTLGNFSIFFVYHVAHNAEQLYHVPIFIGPQMKIRMCGPIYLRIGYISSG